MRTLVCEFQPFHVQTSREFLDIPIQGTNERMRVPVRSNEPDFGNPRKHYKYAYTGNKNVKKGDWALVHNGTTFGIVEIKRVLMGIQAEVTKHVIEVLTTDEFEAYLERNKKVDELRGKMDELDYRLEQHKKLDKYQKLAETDPVAAEILTDLKKYFGIKDQTAIEAAPIPPASPPNVGADEDVPF